MNTYNAVYTPEARLSLGYIDSNPIDILECGPSDSSTSDDNDLREFIDELEFRVSIMGGVPRTDQPWCERFDLRLNYHRSDSVENPADAYMKAAPRYYLLDFLLCLSVSISFCSTALAANLLLSDIGAIIIIQNVLQFVVVSGILYVFATADTYKSANCSIDFLAINWVFNSYNISNVLIYLSIQIVAATIGSYAIIGMYYTQFTQLDKQILLDSIIPSNKYALSADSLILTLFVHALIILGTTFIMTQINSLNCNQIFVQALGYIYLISILYEITVGPISFILYKLIFYGAIVSVFEDAHDSQKNSTLIMMGADTLIKLIGYPLVVYHMKYIWIQMVRRYIEYAI
jgi:glycerol uptake facilitator-like aquaporin